MNKNKVVWSFENHEGFNSKSIKEYCNLKKFEDIIESLKYKPNDELNYSIDFTDSFSRNIFCLSYMFFDNHFV